MRAPNGTYRLSERGASAWPLVITILLLVFFAYKWWEGLDVNRELGQEKEAAVSKLKDAQTRAGNMIDYVEKLSRAVGWNTGALDVTGLDAQGRNSITVTNVDAVVAHVTPKGTMVGAEGAEPTPGVLNALLAEAALVFQRSARTHSEKTGAETTFDTAVFSKEFQDKVQSFYQEWQEKLPNRPAPPSDTDDVEAMQEYQSALQSYEDMLAEYDQALRDLASSEEWKDFSAVVRGAGTWDDPKAEAVRVQLYSFPEGGTETVESLIEPLLPMIKGFKTEILALNSAAVAQADQLRSDSAAKGQALEQTQAELQREQSEFTTQIETLNSELSAKNEQITTLQDQASTADAEKAQVREELMAENRKIAAQSDAYRAGLVNMKARRDHRVRRDDPKGSILAVSQSLGTGVIDRGTADKVVFGMKFVVSSIDRGGNRIDKGEIVITKVTGRHTSKFRVIKQGVTIAGGDRIHNPLYNPSDPVRVVLASKLDKWPKALAVARLEKLGVVVQDEVNGDTDYIVISNSMGAPPAAASEDDEDMDEESAAPGSSVLERLEAQARRFGAVIITERLFDVFLDY